MSFLNKKTDTAQDQQIQALQQQINALVKSFNQWIAYLQDQDKQLSLKLQQKDATDKVQDERINRFLTSLANLAQPAPEPQST